MARRSAIRSPAEIATMARTDIRLKNTNMHASIVTAAWEKTTRGNDPTTGWTADAAV
jgi:hypothetical protein